MMPNGSSNQTRTALRYLSLRRVSAVNPRGVMEVNFDNKNVLVTGASAGIGEATALLFAKYGAKLSLVGRDVASLDDVARRVEAARGVKPLVVVADLAEEEGCERTVKETLQFFGDKLDVLVNNAGVGARTNLEHTDLATFDRVFALNVRGVYNVTRLLAPALVRAQGNVVNVSSVSGLIASVGSLPYSMTKAALDHFSRCIALELAPKGVRVNSVNPGFTVSKFVYRLTDFTEEQYREWLAQAANGIPMGQVCEAEDIAKSIVFLASELARLVTGATLVVDGGVALAGAGNSNIMTQQIKK